MWKCPFGPVFALAVVQAALGHGPQVQVTFNPNNGKIETREIVDTGTAPAAISDLKRVYVMPFSSQSGGAGSGWYTRPDNTLNAFGVPLHPTGPGLAYQYDSQLPGTGWSFSGAGALPNLQGTNFGYSFTDGLKEWTGLGFADPGVEQFQMFRGDGTAVPTIMADTADSGPFNTMPLSGITSLSGNPHNSVGFRLLGDGVSPGLSGTAAGDDGIYLASLQLTSTAANVLASDTFYYVMYKNVSPDEALVAADNLGFDPSFIHVAPDPPTLGLLLAGGAFALRVRRRSQP